jgi:hypothetical protein
MAFALLVIGCDETRPDLIQKVFFTDDDEWLNRDATKDSTELVNNECCNDYLPYPLAIETRVEPYVEPAGDLDYFDLKVTGGSAGQLFLSSERDNIKMRLFSRDMQEYDFAIDTLYGSQSSAGWTVYWTALYGQGPDTTFTLLVQGESRKAQGQYELGWQQIAENGVLQIDSPAQQSRWQRASSYYIRWTLDRVDPVTVALLKGPVVIDILKRDVLFINFWVWELDEDLELGSDYRIMVYLSDDPTTMDISDAFEIN